MQTAIERLAQTLPTEAGGIQIDAALVSSSKTVSYTHLITV